MHRVIYHRVRLSSAFRYLVHILYLSHTFLLSPTSVYILHLVPTLQLNGKWVGQIINSCSFSQCMACLYKYSKALFTIQHNAWTQLTQELNPSLFLCTWMSFTPCIAHVASYCEPALCLQGSLDGLFCTLNCCGTAP